MPKKPEQDILAEAVKAQQQLRDNIEESKQLVEKTQKLLKKATDQASD